MPPLAAAIIFVVAAGAGAAANDVKTETFSFDVPATLPGEARIRGRSDTRMGWSDGAVLRVPPPGAGLAAVRVAYRIVDADDAPLDDLYVHHWALRLKGKKPRQEHINWDLSVVSKDVPSVAWPPGYGLPWDDSWRIEYHLVDTRGTDAGRCVECPCLGNVKGGWQCCMDGQKCYSEAPATPRPAKLLLDVDYVPASSVAAASPSVLAAHADTDFDVVRDCSKGWPGAALKLKLDDRTAAAPAAEGLQPVPASALACPYWTYARFAKGLPHESFRRVRRLTPHFHPGGKRILVYVEGKLRCELLGPESCDFLDEPLDLFGASVVLLSEYDAARYSYGAMAHVYAFAEGAPPATAGPPTFRPKAWPSHMLTGIGATNTYAACMLPRELPGSLAGARGYPAKLADDIDAQIRKSQYAQIYQYYLTRKFSSLTLPTFFLAHGLSCLVRDARYRRYAAKSPGRSGASAVRTRAKRAGRGAGRA